MADLQKTRISETSQALYMPTAYAQASKRKEKKDLLDTIDYKEASISEFKHQKLSSALEERRLSLPKPAPSGPQDELMILAEAFIKAFDAMDNGIRTENDAYVQLQQLDQTQSQAVIDSTRNAVSKEVKAEKLAALVTEYQKSMGEDNEIFGWVMFGVGIAITVAIFASSLFDFGASLLAAPEVAEESFEMADLGATAAETAGDNSEELDDIPIDQEANASQYTNSGAGASAEGESLEESISNADSSINNEGTTFKDTLNKLTKSTYDNIKSGLEMKNLLKMTGRLAVKVAIGGVFGSPMLMKGITGITIADKLEEVSVAQASVGKSLGVLQRNNLYFQYLQKCVQRDGDVLQEEITSSTEVIDTFSSIANAYRGISFGLANAV